MNPDAPWYESAVWTSLKPLHGRKSWGQLPSLLWKIEGGGGEMSNLYSGPSIDASYPVSDRDKMNNL
jgi:hypothetical protein